MMTFRLKPPLQAASLLIAATQDVHSDDSDENEFPITHKAPFMSGCQDKQGLGITV